MTVRNLVWPELPLAEVIIVCAGHLGECGRMRLEASIQAEVPIIAVDGGLKHIDGPVEALVGDLDSVEDELARMIENVYRDEDTSNTDLVKAFKHATSRGWSSVDVIGIDGGSLGHQLAIIVALAASGGSMDICCILEDGILANVVECRRVLGRDQPTFSVFAFGEPATVSIRGAAWSLDEERLEFSTLGARNVAVTDTEVTNHQRAPGLLIALDFDAS